MDERSPGASDIAEFVRAACLAAAREAYENAGVQGLCAEGRWELALDAMKQLDLRALVARRVPRSGPARSE